MSAIERLPREIMWKILDYVPQATINLRMTSRMLKSCSDEYAMLPTSVPFVDEIKISTFTAYCPSANSPNDRSFSHFINRFNPLSLRRRLKNKPEEIRSESISIFIELSSKTSQLFKQRLIQEYSLSIGSNLNGQVLKWKLQREGTQNFKWEIRIEQIDESLFVHLGNCIGKRIERVCLHDFDDTITRNVVSKVVGGKQFGKFSVEGVSKLSKDAGDLLMNITTYKMDLFKLSVGEFGIDPVGLLTHFATLARSMELHQGYVQGVEWTKPSILYGVNDVN